MAFTDSGVLTNAPIAVNAIDRLNSIVWLITAKDSKDISVLRIICPIPAVQIEYFNPRVRSRYGD